MEIVPVTEPLLGLAANFTTFAFLVPFRGEPGAKVVD